MHSLVGCEPWTGLAGCHGDGRWAEGQGWWPGALGPRGPGWFIVLQAGGGDPFPSGRPASPT